MCQTVCIISPVKFTTEAVCSKSSFVPEVAFRLNNFQSYFCARITAAVKFLGPPCCHRAAIAASLCPKIQDPRCGGRSKCERDSRRPRKSAADAGIFKFHFLRRPYIRRSNVNET